MESSARSAHGEVVIYQGQVEAAWILSTHVHIERACHGAKIPLSHR